MSNLVLCYDGTWNNPDQEDNGIPAPTNVFKLHNAIDVSGDSEQIKYYHPGLGGEGGLLQPILGGAFGVGIRRHICSGYQWLASNYSEEDSVYLFGFSRGAFTARSLAGLFSLGLLDLNGLSPKEIWKRVHALYDARAEGKKVEEILGFTPEYQLQGKALPIKFVGVWDTVGALGVPDDLEILNFFDNADKWRFHDNILGKHIKIGRHAMALDEKRSSFTVTHWQPSKFRGQDIKEVWFPGVHSDVGGGYADTTLSDIALEWMMKEAEKAGLVFRDNTIPDASENSSGVMHNSFKGIFSKMRSRPRNIPAICDQNIDCLHSSVLERQSSSPIQYAPYHPTFILKKGESLTVDIYANTRWNNTGVYLEEGRYRFSAHGVWKDSNDACDWKGTEDDKLTMGDIVRGASSFLGSMESIFKKATKNESTDFINTKRVEDFPWFVMTGAISNDGESGVSMKNDGSPHPHQYVELPKYQNKSLEINKPGYLYCFPNDVWTFYENNAGSIQLTIKKVS